MNFKRLLRPSAVLAAALLFSPAVQAAPGDLDAAYGDAGVAKPVLSPNINAIKDMALSGSGGVYICGHNYGPTEDFILAKLTTSGSLDTLFNSGTGYVITPIGGDVDVPVRMAVQEDGKIVLAGFANNGSNLDAAVARYNENGTLDTDFGGGDGIVTFPVGTQDDYLFAIALQEDGKIVLAGNADMATSPSHNFDTVLARLTTSGSLDPEFGGGDGIVTTAIGPDNEAINSLAIQDDGSIVGTGYSNNGAVEDFLLLRYTGTGTLDSNFGGGDGIVTGAISGAATQGNGVVIQPDGQIVVAGSTDDGDNVMCAVLRFSGSGTLDPDFGTGGVVTTDLPGTNDNARDLVLQANGRILVSGRSGDSTAVIRYLAKGSLDTTFGGGDGVALYNLGGGDNAGNSLVLQTDAKILIAGASSASSGEISVPRLENGPMHQPDALIGTAEPTIGFDIYDSDGEGQSIVAKAKKGKTKTFSTVFENDGLEPDTFTLEGQTGNQNFKISYFEGDTDVTALVTSGSFQTPILAPGEAFEITTKVRAKTPLAGKKLKVLINASSDIEPAANDSVLIKAKSLAR